MTAIADRITVMRRGRVVAELGRGAPREEIARAMIGRELDPPLPTERSAPGAPVLEVEGLRVARDSGAPAVAGVSLTVRAGEILGIAGVQGNGQSELVEALCGRRAVGGGTGRIAGRDGTAATPARRLAEGLGHIAEDRHRRGLILDFSVAENLLLGRQREFAGLLGLARGRVAAFARDRIADFDIRPPAPSAPAWTLSGGNQQKVVAARELSRRLRVLVAAEPTRGVDIGAAALIHRRLLAARDAGVGVLLISSELSELRELADRIAVLYRGELVATLPARAATEDELGALMTGARAAVPS